MTTSITTLKRIVAAATVVTLVACGTAPEIEVSGLAAGDPIDNQVTPTTDAAGDLVPWGQLPDADRIERTHSNPTTGCITVDTRLPC